MLFVEWFRNVRDFASVCPVCAQHKSSTAPLFGLVCPLAIAKHPFSHILIGYVTGLPISDDNAVFLIVVSLVLCFSTLLHFLLILYISHPNFGLSFESYLTFLLISPHVTICRPKGSLRGWYSLLSASALIHPLPQSHTCSELTLFLYIPLSAVAFCKIVIFPCDR